MIRTHRCRCSSDASCACRLGLVLGYVSAAAYLKSRVSQILKNWARGDADGLSISMFLCAICGNLFGGLGIVLRIQAASDLAWQLPWLIGMLGTVAMDVAIAWQTQQSAEKQRRRTEGVAEAQTAATDPVVSPLLPPT